MFDLKDSLSKMEISVVDNHTRKSFVFRQKSAFEIQKSPVCAAPHVLHYSCRRSRYMISFR